MSFSSTKEEKERSIYEKIELKCILIIEDIDNLLTESFFVLRKSKNKKKILFSASTYYVQDGWKVNRKSDERCDVLS